MDTLCCAGGSGAETYLGHDGQQLSGSGGPFLLLIERANAVWRVNDQQSVAAAGAVCNDAAGCGQWQASRRSQSGPAPAPVRASHLSHVLRTQQAQALHHDHDCSRAEQHRAPLLAPLQQSRAPLLPSMSL